MTSVILFSWSTSLVCLNGGGSFTCSSGDLAVLLAAGWPIRRLLLFSGMSAALGFLGLAAGTVLGHHLAQFSPWILAVTAGVFLHVALTDMVGAEWQGWGSWGVNLACRRLIKPPSGYGKRNFSMRMLTQFGQKCFLVGGENKHAT